MATFRGGRKSGENFRLCAWINFDRATPKEEEEEEEETLFRARGRGEEKQKQKKEEGREKKGWSSSLSSLARSPSSRTEAAFLPDPLGRPVRWKLPSHLYTRRSARARHACRYICHLSHFSISQEDRRRGSADGRRDVESRSKWFSRDVMGRVKINCSN